MIVSLQIPEVLNDGAIQVLLCKKFESAKRLSRFKPPNFLRRSDTGTLTPKNLNRQNDCIVSNPRIFKDKAIQVLLLKKYESTKRLYRFNTQNLLAMKGYNYFYYYFLGGMRGFTDLILR